MKLPTFTIKDLLIATAVSGAFICAGAGLIAIMSRRGHVPPLFLRVLFIAILASQVWQGAIYSHKRQRPWWLGAALGMLIFPLICFTTSVAMEIWFRNSRSAAVALPQIALPIPPPAEVDKSLLPDTDRYVCIPAAKFVAKSSWSEMIDEKDRAWRYRLLPKDYDEQEPPLESSGVTYFIPAANLDGLRKSLSTLTADDYEGRPPTAPFIEFNN